jgi:hypothetical protein
MGFPMDPVPLTFYWRGRILEVRSDEPLTLYSAPVGIIRRAMARSEGVTSLMTALRASLGSAYLVEVEEVGGRVIVGLRRPGRP